MTRTYKKSASYPHPTNCNHNRYTNNRDLRKRMDRRDRRRLNRLDWEVC